MTHSQRIDNKGRRRARWLSVYNKQTGTHSRTCTREQETKKKVGREVDGLPPFFFCCCSTDLVELLHKRMAQKEEAAQLPCHFFDGEKIVRD